MAEAVWRHVITFALRASAAYAYEVTDGEVDLSRLVERTLRIFVGQMKQVNLDESCKNMDEKNPFNSYMKERSTN